MTISRKQGVVIWAFVILTVVLLGWDKHQHFMSSIDWSYNTITFYGIELCSGSYSYGEKQAPDDDLGYGFFSGIEGQKYVLIVASALIAATLIITAKKK